MAEQRDAWLDNSKFILVTIIVMLHVIPGASLEPRLGYDNQVLQTLELTLFSFAMQAFVFVSGMLSSAELTARRYKALLAQLLIPYFIFETLATVLGGSYNTTSYLLDPSPVLWYLPALFIWRLVLPVVSQLKWYYGMVIALVLSLAVGYEERVGYFMTLSRIFTFFPFFMMGYYAKGYMEYIKGFNTPVAKLLAALVFSSSYLLIWSYYNIDYRWVELSQPYANLGEQGLAGAAIRLAQFAAACILGVAFFVLVPRKESKMSVLGTRTIYPYLLHIPVVFALVLLGFYDENIPPTLQYALVPLAISLAVVLSSRPVEVLFSPVMFPPLLNKIFR